MLRLTLLITFSLFAAIPVFATNYYVATPALYPAANDNNNGTSLATPFATLARAIARATAPGDSILVRSGTYTVTSTIRIQRIGNALRHYVLTAYLPDLGDANSRPVFDFSGMAANSNNIGIVVSAAAYWDIYGIVVKGAGDNGMLLQNSAHHNTITFCSFTRNRDSGLQIRSGSHHCLVVNCDSHENADLGAGTTSMGGNADGFAPKLDVGDSIIFRGCRAWLNSDDGWDGYLKTIGTSYPQGMTTTLEDCWAFRNGYYWLDGSTNSSQNGNGFKMGGSADKNEAHNFVLIRCIAFRNKAKGFDQNGNAGSMYLYNNTAHANLDYDFGLNSSGVTYASGAVLEVINNVSLGARGVTIRSGSAVTRLTNGFVTGTTSTNFNSLDSTGATAMRNLDGSLPEIGYMRLKTAPASAYIDGGTLLPGVRYQGAVGISFNGSAPDLGAFETTPAAVVTYQFIGNGDWDDDTNWLNNSIPPDTLTAGAAIVINPVAGGECFLNVPYTLSAGASLVVMPGATLVIPNNLTIFQ